MKKTNAIRILEKNNIPYELLEYDYSPEDLDVSKIAMDNNLNLEEIYKTLVLKGNNTGLIIAVVPGDKKLNKKKISKASGNKKISLVPISDLEKLTGYIRGGCSPIGMKSPFPVFIDLLAEELGGIWINAGTRGVLMKVDITDLKEICSASIVGISE